MANNVGAGLGDNLTLSTANLSNITRPNDGGDGGDVGTRRILPNPQSPFPNPHSGIPPSFIPHHEERWR
ncbi:MAG: hypothetical protein U7123_16125 [Potamolinea sp.]